jgi:N-acetylneuraminic acid mutarotase
MSRGARSVAPVRAAARIAVFLVMTGLLLSSAGCESLVTSSSQGGGPSSSVDATTDLGITSTIPGGVTSPTAGGGPAVWANLNPAGEVPSRRAGQSMVYDPVSSRSILFGGWDGARPLDDTWAYDPGANAWTRLDPAGEVPSPRSGHSMVYDPASSRALLFGGDSNGRYLNDTWAYDPGANAWTRLDPAGDLPSVRARHSMVYDPVGSRVILFGGENNAQFFNDTWSYDVDTNAWTLLEPAGDPAPGHTDHSMAYDPISKTVILFGGFDQNGYPADDTWSYDPVADTWTELTPAGASPPASIGHRMVYDPETSRVILLGGGDGNLLYNDTWAYDPGANTWTRLDPAGDLPPVRAGHSMVYDPGGGRVILFGGTGSGYYLNDTWAYGG